MPEAEKAKALAECITAIGSGAFEPALYQWLGLAGPIDNVTMIAFFQNRAPEVFFSHANELRVFEKINSEYVRGVYLLDPVYGLHTGNAAEGLYRLSDIAPDQFTRNEYYATYYRRTTLIDELVFLAHPAVGVTVTICVGRDATSQRRFSARVRDQLQAAAPVTIALANRHWAHLQSSTETDAPEVVEMMRNRLKQERDIALSPRQSEIAFLILKGHSSVSIGLVLGISPQTVKVIRKQLYKKCTISSQAELFSLLTPCLLGL